MSVPDPSDAIRINTRNLVPRGIFLSFGMIQEMADMSSRDLAQTLEDLLNLRPGTVVSTNDGR